MNQNHRKVGRVLLLAVVAMSVAGAGVGGPLVALDGWLEARSPNLRLITDLEPARADELLKQLEALRSSVAGELFGRPVPRRLPTTIVVFAEDPSYAPFRVADREGQFYSTLFESLVVLNGGAESRPLEMAAAHEYTHAIVTEMEIALPLWLHEGLAEYYSTFRLEEGVVAVGRSVPGHRARLRNRAFAPFEALATVDGSSAGYHGTSGARFYAQSWLTVHYLLSDAGRGMALDGLVWAARRGGAGASPTALTGASSDTLDRELRRYLNRDSVPVTLFPVTDVGSLPVEIRRLSKSEAAYHLGMVALEQARHDPDRRRVARELFETSLALDPTRGDAHAGMGSLEALLGRPRAATERFERAVFLDALEGRSYANYSEHLVESSPPAGDTGETARRAYEMLIRALDLEPRHRRLAQRLERLAPAFDAAPSAFVARPATPPV